MKEGSTRPIAAPLAFYFLRFCVPWSKVKEDAFIPSLRPHGIRAIKRTKKAISVRRLKKMEEKTLSGAGGISHSNRDWGAILRRLAGPLD